MCRREGAPRRLVGACSSLSSAQMRTHAHTLLRRADLRVAGTASIGPQCIPLIGPARSTRRPPSTHPAVADKYLIPSSEQYGVALLSARERPKMCVEGGVTPRTIDRRTKGVRRSLDPGRGIPRPRPPTPTAE